MLCNSCTCMCLAYHLMGINAVSLLQLHVWHHAPVISSYGHPCCVTPAPACVVPYTFMPVWHHAPASVPVWYRSCGTWGTSSMCPPTLHTCLCAILDHDSHLGVPWGVPVRVSVRVRVRTFFLSVNPGIKLGSTVFVTSRLGLGLGLGFGLGVPRAVPISIHILSTRGSPRIRVWHLQG